MSICCIVSCFGGLSANAETTTTKSTTTSTTLLSVYNIQKLSNGWVRRRGFNLIYFNSKTKKSTTLVKKYDYNKSFIVKNNRLYYMRRYTIYSIKINGKDKKKFTKHVFGICGCYENYIIAYAKRVKKLYKINIKNDKKTEINALGRLFDGKIYSSNKENDYKDNVIYDLATKKTTVDYEGRLLIGYSTNCIYLIDNDKNLYRIDKDGEKVLVEKNIGKFYGCNNGKTVIFSYADDKNTIYRKTGSKKAVKLCTITSIFNTIHNECGEQLLVKAFVSNNKVGFVAHSDGQCTGAICCVDINGGTPKCVYSIFHHAINCVELANNRVYYTAKGRSQSLILK